MLIQAHKALHRVGIVCLTRRSNGYRQCNQDMPYKKRIFSDEARRTGRMLATLQKICHALHVPIGILLFLGTSHDEFGEMSKELEAELAKSTLVLLSAPANEQNNWSNVFVQSPDIISPQRIPILTKTFLVNPLPVPHNKKCQIWWSGILQSVSAKSYQLPFAFCITAPITPKAISAKQNITPAVSMSLSLRR